MNDSTEMGGLGYQSQIPFGIFYSAKMPTAFHAQHRQHEDCDLSARSLQAFLEVSLEVVNLHTSNLVRGRLRLIG
jgi:hypothetical protein